MNLKTRYMGFDLPHPLIPGASPLVDDLGKVRQLEDAGAPLIIMHSLFEEQIVAEEWAVTWSMEQGEHAHGEANSYLPRPEEFVLGPHEYLEHLRKIKAAVQVPVIASLNGTTLGGWVRYAKLMEEAGADGLELNVYELETDPEESGVQVEQRTLDVVRAVRESIKLPLAVKLSPFYTSIAHFARQLDQLGVSALVLFNRFYQADFNVEQLEVVREVKLSTSAELLLRLRWIAILHGRLSCNLGLTGGIHTGLDVVKALMAGADGVQTVSALLAHGPRRLEQLRKELSEWLQIYEYESVQQLRGSLSLNRCPNPKAFERANYMHILQSWRE